MSLVSTQEIVKLLKLEKLGWFGRGIANFVMRVLKIKALNTIHANVKDKSGDDFFASLLEEFHFNYSISDQDLKKIPKEGSFITVSNHPLGGADGILLLRLLTEIRPDFKITGNFILHKIKPIIPFVIAVNPFDRDHKGAKRKMGATQLALNHIESGGPLGFFPAGQVSTKKENGIYQDREWSRGAIRIIQKSQVPVIPIYFHARNSKKFYFFSKISGLFRSAMLPGELANKNKHRIDVKIGNLITVEELNTYANVLDLRKFLREKTYAMSSFYGKL